MEHKNLRALREDNIISKTSADGETSFEAVPEDVARQLNGTTQTDQKGNRTSVKDTGKKTLGEIEGPGKTTLNQQDILNLAKDLDVCTKEALRAAGNEVAYTQQFFNKAKATITIKAYFQHDADNPGRPEGQEFQYRLAEGKIVLDKGEGTVTNIAAIRTQSGTANINRDLAIDSIKNVLNKKEDTATGEAGSSEPAKDVKGDPMLENFSKAVDAYRKNKSKETIKELLRSARDFPGDDIQHKFANAVQAYKGQSCLNPDSEECCSDGQCMSDCELKLSESLFLRLLEFAKEDAKDDVDLHTVAENLSRLCSEGKCASIEDYETILGNFEQEHPDASGEQSLDEIFDQKEHEYYSGFDAGKQVQDVLKQLSQWPDEKRFFCHIFEFKPDMRSGYRSAYTWTRADIETYLREVEPRIVACYMPDYKTVQVNLASEERRKELDKYNDEFQVAGGKSRLTENEPDEQERWDDDDYKIPEDTVFYYDPETKEVFDESSVPLEAGKRYIAGTISCLKTDIEDESFSHEFGTEYIYVPVCTEVGIEIEGLSDDEDFYDSEEDVAAAKNMLTRDDYKVIEDWGKEWMTDHIEQD